jgi:single-stranded-DNA-specific exonuclease
MKLKRLNEQPNRGLLSVIKLCGLEKHNITIDDIVFKIGPRINAAGRMEIDDEDDGSKHYSGGHRAVKLLIANTDEKAKKFGDFIDKSNADRKNIDRSITQEAADLIEKNPDIKNKKSTVVYNPNWVKGVVGIVASRLIERYYRPTVVLTMSNGFVTGSARSVAGFDLYQAVESCADLLENFGGHTYAAGLTMKPENVEEFTRRFNQYVENHIEDDMLIPQVDIDSELLFSDITTEFRATLSRFQPFGPGNSAPVFITRGVSDRGEVRLVGNDNDHLKLELVQHEKPNTSIAAIAFQQPTHYEHIRRGGAIDVCYCVVENHYRGMVTPQLRVRDIKPVNK